MQISSIEGIVYATLITDCTPAYQEEMKHDYHTQRERERVLYTYACAKFSFLTSRVYKNVHFPTEGETRLDRRLKQLASAFLLFRSCMHLSFLPECFLLKIDEGIRNCCNLFHIINTLVYRCTIKNKHIQEINKINILSQTNWGFLEYTLTITSWWHAGSRWLTSLSSMVNLPSVS